MAYTRLTSRPRSSSKFSGRGLIVVAVAWLCLLSFGAYELFRPSPIAHGIKGSGKVHHQAADLSPGTLGGEREALLKEATRHYLADHPDAPVEMAAGKAFAPAEYLNEELAREGARWRVRAVHGLAVEIYDVS